MSKELFMLMREEEMSEISNFSKPVIAKKADQVIQMVLDGEADPINVKIACKTAIEYFTQIDAGVKSAAFIEANKFGKEKVERLNAHFETKNGASSVDYSVDPVWKELKERLKKREEVLKIAAKIGAVMFDGEDGETPGDEIPKCPMTYGSDMIVITLNNK